MHDVYLVRECRGYYKELNLDSHFNYLCHTGYFFIPSNVKYVLAKLKMGGQNGQKMLDVKLL